MNFNEILTKIEDFSQQKNIQNKEITKLFNWINKEISGEQELSENESKRLIETTFTFLKKQHEELEENIEIIHLVETISFPSHLEFYYNKLIKLNTTKSSINGIILLVRYLNISENKIFFNVTELLKNISENENNSNKSRHLANEYYQTLITSLKNYISNEILLLSFKKIIIRKTCKKFKATPEKTRILYSEVKSELKKTIIQRALVYLLIGSIFLGVGLAGVLSNKEILLIGMLLIGSGSIITSLSYLKLLITK